MVSKASEDFPEPESPVMQTSLFRGRRTVTSLRLCSRAPWTTSSSEAITDPVYRGGSDRTSVRYEQRKPPEQAEKGVWPVRARPPSSSGGRFDGTPRYGHAASPGQHDRGADDPQPACKQGEEVREGNEQRDAQDDRDPAEPAVRSLGGQAGAGRAEHEDTQSRVPEHPAVVEQQIEGLERRS